MEELFLQIFSSRCLLLNHKILAERDWFVDEASMRALAAYSDGSLEDVLRNFDREGLLSILWGRQLLIELVVDHGKG